MPVAMRFDQGPWPQPSQLAAELPVNERVDPSPGEQKDLGLPEGRSRTLGELMGAPAAPEGPSPVEQNLSPTPGRVSA